jgi:tRNA-modifying protein YgfZ
LRAKLEITARDDLEVVVGKKGYVDPRSAEMGYRLFAPSGNFKAGTGYDSARISLGLADTMQDLGSNVMFPHEANFDRIGGLSFSKGCYVGQEVVSRMQHRGTARSRIMRVKCQPSAPLKGTEIRSGTILLGEILSSQGESALALIRADRLAEATLPFLADGTQVAVLP